MMLMKGFRGAIVLVAACAAVAGARAQDAGTGLSVRAGLFMPGHTDARDAGSQWLAGGIEYRFRELAQRADGTDWVSISADYLGKGDFRSVPVTVNYVSRSQAMYLTVGIGVNIVGAPETVGTGGSAVTTNETRTRFAYQFGVGYDFERYNSPMFFEARYFGSSEGRVSGFGFFLGIRL